MDDQDEVRAIQLKGLRKGYALVLTEPIKSNPGWGAWFKRRSGKFAANPLVLDYLRMPVAKEKPRLCRT